MKMSGFWVSNIPGSPASETKTPVFWLALLRKAVPFIAWGKRGAGSHHLSESWRDNHKGQIPWQLAFYTPQLNPCAQTPLNGNTVPPQASFCSGQGRRVSHGGAAWVGQLEAPGAVMDRERHFLCLSRRKDCLRHSQARRRYVGRMQGMSSS